MSAEVRLCVRVLLALDVQGNVACSTLTMQVITFESCRADCGTCSLCVLNKCRLPNSHVDALQVHNTRGTVGCVRATLSLRSLNLCLGRVLGQRLLVLMQLISSVYGSGPGLRPL
jgi:hypothetical protein